MRVHTRPFAAAHVAARRRMNAASLLACLALIGSQSAAARVGTLGGNCVETNDATPESMWRGSSLVNFGTAVEQFFCGTFVNQDKVLRSVAVTVIDVHATKAVECTVCNGTLCMSIGSTGSDGSKFLNFDLPDAQWASSTVLCSVPERVGSGASSGIISVSYTTN